MIPQSRHLAKHRTPGFFLLSPQLITGLYLRSKLYLNIMWEVGLENTKHSPHSWWLPEMILCFVSDSCDYLMRDWAINWKGVMGRWSRFIKSQLIKFCSAPELTKAWIWRLKWLMLIIVGNKKCSPRELFSTLPTSVSWFTDGLWFLVVMSSWWWNGHVYHNINSPWTTNCVVAPLVAD